MDEKKKVIIDITKPEDIDNVKCGQWMHFVCKKCDKDVVIMFKIRNRLDGYKRMLCQNCNFKQTNFERYGVENMFQLPEIQEKIKQTKLNKYGDENYNNRDSAKQTNFERYGVENPMQSPKFLEKAKQTNLERHGVEYPAQSPEIQEKINQTRFEKYGVKYITLLPGFQKMHCRYEYFGLRFDSSWELYYYIYQTKILKVNCVRNYGEVYFEYIADGKLHRYIPDFITESKIVEIKGDHLIDNDNNLIKRYKGQDKNMLLAKTRCMLDNVDVIITEKEIRPMIKEVKRLFGIHCIDQFKISKDEEGLKAS